MKWRGFLYPAACACLWATGGVASKYLFLHGLTPQDVVQARTTLASSFLAITLGLFNPRLLAAGTGFWALLLLGMLGPAMNQFSYFYSISKIEVGIAILLEFTAPLLITLYSLATRREPVTRRVILGVCLAFLGSALVVGAHHSNWLSLNFSGVMAGLVAALSFAFFSISVETHIRRWSIWTINLYALGMAATIWNTLHPPLIFWGRLTEHGGWGWLLYLVFAGTLLPSWLYGRGLQLVRPVLASSIAMLEPVVASILAFSFLGETLGAYQILGGITVLGSTLWIYLAKLQRAPSPRSS